LKNGLNLKKTAKQRSGKEIQNYPDIPILCCFAAPYLFRLRRESRFQETAYSQIRIALIFKVAKAFQPNAVPTF